MILHRTQGSCQGTMLHTKQQNRKTKIGLRTEEHRRLKMIFKCNLIFNEAILPTCVAFSIQRYVFDCAILIIRVLKNCKAITKEVKGNGIPFLSEMLSVQLFHLKCI